MVTLIYSLAILNSMAFVFIGALHLYWAYGGTLGFAAALPTDESGKRILNPGRKECIAVALFLLLFAMIYICRAGLITVPVPNAVLYIGSWLVAAIFLLRAVGDFKYVGFTKRIKTTDFARNDTKYYSPLCFLLSISGLLISLS